MTERAWYSSDDPRSLPQRVERVIGLLREHENARCERCGASACGHAVVFSIVAGHEDRPFCLDCIAAENSKERTTIRDEMTLFVHSKPCLSQGWRFAGLREGFDPDALLPCLWSDGEAAPLPPDTARDDGLRGSEIQPEPDDWFDAGDQGCGDLVLALRIRMNRLAPGGILRLTATDAGAPVDIPAWCRLTGNRLIKAHHPDYFITRKEDS